MSKIKKNNNKFQEIDCSKPIKNKEAHPTSKEMEKFAKIFSVSDWNLLCYDSRFLSIFDQDLKAAQKLAKEILKKK